MVRPSELNYKMKDKTAFTFYGIVVRFVNIYGFYKVCLICIGWKFSNGGTVPLLSCQACYDDCWL
ncbi:hypothetical protein SB6413_04562 [Klebsiella pasteurii]|nr:hypothetical protein SB6413_04562 [Klebsiella pasteurii]